MTILNFKWCRQNLNKHSPENEPKSINMKPNYFKIIGISIQVEATLDHLGRPKEETLAKISIH